MRAYFADENIKISSSLDPAKISYNWFKEFGKSFLLAMFVIVADHVFEKYFKYANKLRKSSDSLQIDKSVLSFGLFMTIVLYVVLQSLDFVDKDFKSMYLDNWIDHFWVLMIVFLLKTIITKVISIWYQEEFEFIGGLVISFPLLLIAFCFFPISPLLILPVTIIGIYILAILDKRSIIMSTDHVKFKSTSMILNVFTVFKWIPLLMWWSNKVILYKMIKRYEDICSRIDQIENLPTFLSINLKSDLNTDTAIGIVGLIMTIYTYIVWPPSLDSHMREKFYDKNSRVSYKDVSDEFTSSYKKKDPQNKLRDFRVDNSYTSSSESSKQ